MTEELEMLLAAARARPHMTTAEREEQTRNFAAGNVGLENVRVTRAVVDEAVRRKLRWSPDILSAQAYEEDWYFPFKETPHAATRYDDGGDWP